VKICDRSPEGQEAVRMEGTAQLEPFERRLHDKTLDYVGNEIRPIADKHGGMLIQWGPVSPHHVPFGYLFESKPFWRS
jgi:hypothetical protein